MFDLTRAVFDWRLEMERHEALCFDMLDELESHLLEEIDRLRAGGMEEEQAFRRAVCTLGTGASVQSEVEKIEPDSVTRNRARWILMGCLIGPLVLHVARLVFSAFFTGYYYCFLGSWGGVDWNGLGFPALDSHGLGVFLLMVLSTWLGLRWLSRRQGIRWLHKCRSYLKHPLSLAAGVVALGLLFRGVWLVRNLWLARSIFGPEDFGRMLLMMFIPNLLAMSLLPLLCLGFLRQWHKDLATHSALFWTTSGWLLLYVSSSLFGLFQQGIIMTWASLRPDSWKLSSQLYSSRYDYFNEWDAVFIFCPLVILLLMLVLKGGSGLLRRPQALILWSVRHPILSGTVCLVGPVSSLCIRLIVHRSLGTGDIGSVVLVNGLMGQGWVVILPLMWAMALRRLRGERIASAPAPAPSS